ncbi:MAG: hypothetical protein Q9227_007950 [Pyrenula ochraceoflavens]
MALWRCSSILCADSCDRDSKAARSDTLESPPEQPQRRKLSKQKYTLMKFRRLSLPGGIRTPLRVRALAASGDATRELQEGDEVELPRKKDSGKRICVDEKKAGSDPQADMRLMQLSADEAYLSCEYLEREVLPGYPNSNIVLLRPSMSQLLKLTPDVTTISSNLGDFSRTTHIFLPVNDNTNAMEAEAGTHWSLLLVSIVDGVAFHYDSLPPGNARDAQHLTKKLSQLLRRPLRFIDLDDSPTQENSSDCGVFVCYLMRHLLLKRLLQVRSDEKISMSMGGKCVDAREVRREITRIVDARRKEGVRRSRSASPMVYGSRRHSNKSKSPPRFADDR